MAWCSSDLVGRVRRLAQCWIWLAVLRPRSVARSSSGAPTISASGLADGGHPSGGRAASGAQQRPQGLPLTAAARDGRAVLAKRLASGSDGVQRVALGATATGWPLGSAHLDDPLAALLQRHRQASAEATRSLDRPQATARNVTVRKVEQLLVTRGVGTGGGLGEDPAEVGDGGRGQGVAVGVDADDAVDELCQHGHAVVLLGEGGRGRRRPGRSHRAA